MILKIAKLKGETQPEQGLRVLARIIARKVAKGSRDDPESPISPASGYEQRVRDEL
jgi:hypothetical protein